MSLQVRKKNFGWFLVDHHADGRVAINCKGSAQIHDMLRNLAPEHFHVPKYLGNKGWVGHLARRAQARLGMRRAGSARSLRARRAEETAQPARIARSSAAISEITASIQRERPSADHRRHHRLRQRTGWSGGAGGGGAAAERTGPTLMVIIAVCHIVCRICIIDDCSTRTVMGAGPIPVGVNDSCHSVEFWETER